MPSDYYAIFADRKTDRCTLLLTTIQRFFNVTVNSEEKWPIWRHEFEKLRRPSFCFGRFMPHLRASPHIEEARSETRSIRPNFDYNYSFSIDLESYGMPFGAKSIEKYN